MAKIKKAEPEASLRLFPESLETVSAEEIQRLLDEARKLVNYQVNDFSAELLSSKFKDASEAEGDIFVPTYQRKLVWSDQRQSYFIESLLLRVPIPPLFLYDVDGRLEIIDGSQRMRTINRFMRNELRLAELEKLDFINGFTFQELPPATQLRFKNTPIRTFVLTEDTDGLTRFDIFRRLNTSGKPLTDAQVRVGAFPGPLLDLVRDLAEGIAFRRLCPVGKANGDPTTERQELVLRFFAYADRYAVRQAVIREDMLYHDVSEFWRRDALRHCLHELLSQGSRHDTLYQKIDAFFAATPAWDPRNADLPFPGNINHTAICDFCDKLGIRLSAHRSARGGSDLETIRRNRNSLAHGHEKFSDVGATVTINDLNDTYHRATIFMRAVLRALENYIQKRRYVQPSHRRSSGTAARGPSASSALGSRPMP